MQLESAKYLEALHRLDDRDHETAARITDFERIIGFRNILIHLAEVEALLAAPRAGPGRS